MTTETKHYTTPEILEQARHLGMHLAESEVLAQYRQAEEKMANDEEACRLTGILKKARQDLNALQMADPQDADAVTHAEAALYQADGAMKAYPLIAAYYQAGEALNGLIYQINQILKFYCLDQDETVEGSGTHNCSSCGGGCHQ